MVGPTEIHSPKTPGSAASSVRIHSPYCEATGPIVQEGFVASRVRALQGLQVQSARPSTHSHSPLTPCPIPKATRIYEPLATPGPKALKLTSTTPSDCLPHRYPFRGTSHQGYERPKSGDHTEMQTTPRLLASAAGGEYDRTHSGLEIPTRASNEPYEPEKEIHSPRAIPPKLAKSLRLWDSSEHSEEPALELTIREHGLRQRRSLAEKLSTMVERGWNGCDMCVKAINERQGLRKDMPALHACRNRTVYQHQSASKAEHPFHHLDEYAPAPDTKAFSRQCSYYDDRSSEFQDTVGNLASHPARSNYQQRQGEHNTGTSAIRRRNTDPTGSTESEEAQPKATKRRRAWTLHQPHRSNGDDGHRIKLRTLSSCHGIDRQPAKPGHQKNNIEILQLQDNKGSQPENSGRLSPAASYSPSSRISSPIAQRTKRSDTRTSSILGNFLTGKWLRMATMDRKPQLRDLSTRSSFPVLNTAMRPHTLAECGHDDVVKEPMLVNHSRNPSGTVAAALPGTLADLGTDTGSAEAFPKNAGIPGYSEHNPTATKSRASSLDIKAMSTEPITHSANHSPTSVQSSQAESLADASPLSVRSDNKLKAKGIKKVQVIVSLDGADDLVVEARLQTKRQGGRVKTPKTGESRA
ncbi:MAG: hypothetical protein Q9217_001002 [Psora testacea]